MSHDIALLVGAGINQEITPEVLRVIEAAGVDITWHRFDVVGEHYREARTELTRAIAAVEEIGLALKTRLLTPADGPVNAAQNLNVAFRRELQLYAGVRAIRSLPGVSWRYPDLDLIIVRENSEGIYKGLEHEIVPGVVESIKVVTREASERIARFAFETAAYLERSHVTFIHKANIMKRSDGLFLEAAQDVAAQYPQFGFRDVIVDAACMQLVLNPSQFDVILTTNMFGDILSDEIAGLVGGLGLAPGANIGDDAAMFEAVHGSAPDIAGQGIANPTALLLASALMLDHCGLKALGDRLRTAIQTTLNEPANRTRDLGGNLNTKRFTEALIANL